MQIGIFICETLFSEGLGASKFKSLMFSLAPKEPCHYYLAPNPKCRYVMTRITDSAARRLGQT